MTAIVVIAANLIQYQRVAEHIGRDARVRYYHDGALRGIYGGIIIFMNGWIDGRSREEIKKIEEQVTLSRPSVLLREWALV